MLGVLFKLVKLQSNSKSKRLNELDDFDKMLLIHDWFGKWTNQQQKNILRMLINIGMPSKKGSGF